MTDALEPEQPTVQEMTWQWVLFVLDGLREDPAAWEGVMQRAWAPQRWAAWMAQALEENLGDEDGEPTPPMLEIAAALRAGVADQYIAGILGYL